MRTKMRRSDRRPAQAITELAIILPVLMVILLGIVDLGRAFYQAMAVQEAVQAGALVALNWHRVTDLCPATCATQQVLNAIEEAPSGITIVDSDITLSPTSAWSGNDSWQPGQTFTITVVHRFRFISPYLNIGSGQIVWLTSNITATRNQ